MYPRDREGEFEPQLIPKGARRFSGFDDSVISLYGRGMTVREIQAHLKEIYHTEVSADLISTITDGVLEEVTRWQNRALDRTYPILYLDCLYVKSRDNNIVLNTNMVLKASLKYCQKEIDCFSVLISCLISLLFTIAATQYARTGRQSASLLFLVLF